MITQTTALDDTDHFVGLDAIHACPRPPLVHEGEVGAKLLAETFGDFHPPGVGRNDDEFGGPVRAGTERTAARSRWSTGKLKKP